MFHLFDSISRHMYSARKFQVDAKCQRRFPSIWAHSTLSRSVSLAAAPSWPAAPSVDGGARSTTLASGATAALPSGRQRCRCINCGREAPGDLGATAEHVARAAVAPIPSSLLSEVTTGNRASNNLFLVTFALGWPAQRALPPRRHPRRPTRPADRALAARLPRRRRRRLVGRSCFGASQRAGSNSRRRHHCARNFRAPSCRCNSSSTALHNW